jgi:hypothetical protein
MKPEAIQNQVLFLLTTAVEPSQMTMTLSRFKRLTLVLTIPLLISGAIFSYSTSDLSKALGMVCELSGGAEECEVKGDMFGKSIYTLNYGKSNLFIIHTSSQSSFASIYAQGSSRLIRDAWITDVEDNFGSAADSLSPDLIGKKASIWLGREEGGGILACSELFLGGEKNEFSASCRMDGRGPSIVSFYTSDSDFRMLSNLRFAISEELKVSNRHLLWEWFANSFIFLLLYFAISLLLYLLHKAYMYVKGPV